MRKKGFYSWGLFILIIFSIIGEINLLEVYQQSSSKDMLNNLEDSHPFYDVPRLRSDKPVFQNESYIPPESLNFWTPLISESNQSSSSTEFSSGDRISFPLFQLNGDPDLNITKTEYDALINKRNYFVYFVYNVLSDPLLNILRGEDLQNITDFNVKFPFGKWYEIEKKTFRVLDDLK